MRFYTKDYPYYIIAEWIETSSFLSARQKVAVGATGLGLESGIDAQE